jgi:prepilin-type N-terminal cleavage/methylation domain-containing protein
MSKRHSAGHDGFTLVESLAAMALIAVGCVTMAAALQHGLSGIELGRGESAAVFLAEDKLEELRGLALADWTNTALQPGTTTEHCRPSGGGCSATPIPASLRRTTTVAAGSGGTCSAQCKIVSVSVFYRAMTVLGQLDQERRVDILAMFVSRT